MNELDREAAARHELGRRIQLACQRQRITVKQLADRAGYDEKTVRNAIKGQKTRAGTLENICEVLKIESGNGSVVDSQVAPATATDMHGGYSQVHYEDYIGLYLSYRRSFTFPDNILRSLYEFDWDAEKCCLIFREIQAYQSKELSKQINYSQEGEIFISNTVNLLHLLTIHKGAVRLITLTRMKVNDQTLRGSVLTQAQGEFYFQPSVSPICFQKLNPDIKAEMVVGQVGPLRPDDPEYEAANRALRQVQERVAIFAVAPPAPTAGQGNGLAA